jgi:hypothetical protein
MAKNEARRQKQLAKKKAKRDEKRTQLARLTSNDPTVRLATADSWPVVEALVPENLWELGKGQLIIARRQPDGRLACAVFLVDTWCLGVKNAFWRPFSKFDYDELVRECEQACTYRRVAPEYFAKLIFAAVEYARSLGFAPHPDYRHARLLLSGIDVSLCPESFVFGKGGKPFYMRGPQDSPGKARAIAHQVHQVGGEFLIPLRDSEDIFDAADDWDPRLLTTE